MVIAEAGVNHNGDVRLAHELVDAAKAVGADAVKFQMFDPKRLDPPGERRDMLKGLVLRPADFCGMKDHADSVGVEFMATPFDVGSLMFLAELGIQRIKISSADLRNDTLLKATAGCPVILSTGMATLEEIERAIGILRKRPVLLHCTSAYPAPVEDVNLRAMQGLRPFGSAVGLSDHTPSLVIPAAAVAMGAVVIEKHLTLDCRMEGPDHRASLEPRDFAEMVANIREVEAALGDGVKRPMPSEAAVMKVRDEREAHRCAS